jgi:5-amino-6-(D-ribitylamino)uracil---L-tyrosine 4-hydroxyphenyl transferase
LRVHALSRVLLHGAIKNIQVSWVKLGFQLSLDCLNAGANDFSGTLMEESISKAAGANFGEFVEPADFRRMIRSIGRMPAERTTGYKIRRTFDSAQDSETIEPSQTRPASPFPLLNASDAQPAHHVTHGDGAY